MGRPFTCRTCGEMFAYRHVMRRHNRLLHPMPSPTGSCNMEAAAASALWEEEQQLAGQGSDGGRGEGMPPVLPRRHSPVLATFDLGDATCWPCSVPCCTRRTRVKRLDSRVESENCSDQVNRLRLAAPQSPLTSVSL